MRGRIGARVPKRCAMTKGACPRCDCGLQRRNFGRHAFKIQIEGHGNESMPAGDVRHLANGQRGHDDLAPGRKLKRLQD